MQEFNNHQDESSFSQSLDNRSSNKIERSSNKIEARKSPIHSQTLDNRMRNELIKIDESQFVTLSQV